MTEGPLVVVSGVPGSGKTTLARALAAELGWPLLEKDVIKEALFDALGSGDLEWSIQLGRASHQVLLALAVWQPHGIVEAHFSAALGEPALRGLGRPLIQVYCDCPLDTAVARYRDRVGHPDRHPGHHPDHQDDAAIAHWSSTPPQPLDLPGPLHRIDTTGPVDVVSVAALIRHEAAA